MSFQVDWVSLKVAARARLGGATLKLVPNNLTLGIRGLRALLDLEVSRRQKARERRGERHEEKKSPNVNKLSLL